MQQINTIAAIMIILIFAASCKKETSEISAPSPANQNKVVKEKNLTNGDFKKYSYDAQGKVIKVESATNAWNIEYLPSMIKVTRKRISDDKLLGTDEYSINASGRMISSVSKSATGVVAYNYEYEYDNSGYMIRMKESYANGEVYEDFVTNPTGNPVTVKNYYNGILNDVTDYYYNADVKNLGTGTCLISYYGIEGFAGKIPQREISEFKRFDASGVLSYHKINTFITGSDRTIQKYKSTYPGLGIVHEWSVSYQ